MSKLDEQSLEKALMGLNSVERDVARDAIECYLAARQLEGGTGMSEKKRQKNFDNKCRELAEYFLTDEPHLLLRVDELADAIQERIEDWINFDSTYPSKAKL